MNEIRSKKNGDHREGVGRTARQHRSAIDIMIRRTLTASLASFGLNKEERKELCADLQHLRRWRKSVEQAQSHAVKAAITIIVTGLAGMMWLGIKAMLGE